MRQGQTMEIPKEDLAAINKSFENNKQAQTIRKDVSGNRMSAGVREVNPRTYILECFGGRVLKGDKSVIPVGGKQVLVGTHGQLFDSIPEELSSLVAWAEADFQ